MFLRIRDLLPGCFDSNGLHIELLLTLWGFIEALNTYNVRTCYVENALETHEFNNSFAARYVSTFACFCQGNQVKSICNYDDLFTKLYASI